MMNDNMLVVIKNPNELDVEERELFDKGIKKWKIINRNLYKID